MIKHLLVILWIGILGIQLVMGQNKPPVAENDYGIVVTGRQVSINFLINDFGVEGHELQAKILGGSNGGVYEVADSILTYRPAVEFNGLDSIKYRLVDLDNGLSSEIAYIYIEVTNYGFAYLDVNNVDARINSWGNHFWDGGRACFSVPKNAETGTLFNMALWCGGLDPNDSIHLAMEMFRRNPLGGGGAEFYSGPVREPELPDSGRNWNRVWKLSVEELSYHKTHWWLPDYQVPDVIATWPAHGDTTHGETFELAPYVDKNENGMYEPEQGDYPVMRGDQCIFFIYNDMTGEPLESGGPKVGLEVHGMAYAFDCAQDPALWNAIFFHYDVYNRSDTVYHDTYLSLYTDFDLGNPQDDYIATDVERSMVYAYNSDEEDEGGAFYSGYGLYPPAQGVVLLKGALMDFDGEDNPVFDGLGNPLCGPGLNGFGFGDGEIDNESHGLSYSFSESIASDFLSWQTPENDLEGYRCMISQWPEKGPLMYGGAGILEFGADGPECRFVMPGNTDTLCWGTDCLPPNGEKFWTEYSAGIQGGDRRIQSSTGPFTFHPADKQTLDIALIYARDSVAEPEPSVKRLKEYTDHIKVCFLNDSTPCGGGFSGVAQPKSPAGTVRLAPNPFTHQVVLELDEVNLQGSYTLINLNGCMVYRGAISKNRTHLPLDDLPAGIYIVYVQTKENQYRAKMVKM